MLIKSASCWTAGGGGGGWEDLSKESQVGGQSGTDPNSVSNGLWDFGQAAALRASVSPSDMKVFVWI